MAPSTPSKTKVVTNEVRLSYAHLFEPWSGKEDQEKKYSVTLLIPKSDKETYRKLRAAEAAAAEAGKAKFGGKVPKVLKSVIHDGDTEADLDDNPEYAGHWYMSVSSKTKPGLVDRALNPILDSEELYSGAYARVSINAFAYSVSGNKGVSFGLNHVQKLRDGDFLGGRSRAEDDFDELDDEDLDDDDLVG